MADGEETRSADLSLGWPPRHCMISLKPTYHRPKQRSGRDLNMDGVTLNHRIRGDGEGDRSRGGRLCHPPRSAAMTEPAAEPASAASYRF